MVVLPEEEDELVILSEEEDRRYKYKLSNDELNKFSWNTSRIMLPRNTQPSCWCCTTTFITPARLSNHSSAGCPVQAHTLSVKSQEPVDMEVPSGDVLRQETLFSWP